MNNDTIAPSNKLLHVLTLIEYLPDALGHRMAPLGQVQQQLEELDGRTCTGNAHWRDKDTEGKTAKLYILHGTDQACPVHGKPEKGKRIRTYVGSKLDKIADALAAIEREIERRELDRKVSRLEETIGRTLYRIKNIYHLLDYIPPDPGEDALPIPRENIKMETE